MAKLTFPANPTTGDTYTGDNGVNYLYDGVKWVGGIASASNQANIFLTAIDVVTETPSGNGSLAYDDAGTFTFTPAIGGGGGGAGDITSITAGDGLTGGGSSGDITISLDDSGVVPKTYGNASVVPQITVDQYGRITNVSNVAVSGGGTPTSVQRFKLNYNTSGQLASTSNLTSGITSVTIDSSSGGDVTITFDDSFNYPPGAIMLYGYVYASNKYVVSNLETTMGLREIPGGGVSGSPTAFNSSASPIALKLRLRETETGASRSFGTVTHAWIHFVMND